MATFSPFVSRAQQLAKRSQRADLAYFELRQKYDMDHEDERTRNLGMQRFVSEVLAKIPQRLERQKVMLGVGMIERIED